jgi:hypothetical protein
MAGVTAAVIGAGAAVAGVNEARKAGKAAKRQGERQAAASEAGIEEQRRQFDLTRRDMISARDFAREQQQPFQEAGVAALEQQKALMGLSGAEAQQQAFANFQESPGQAFLRKRQERALLRNASAIGGLGGGNVRTALQEQAAGFALQDLENQFGRLGQIAGQGRAAGASLGAGATGTAGALGQFGARSVESQNQARQAAAEARASGALGQRQARAQGMEQLAQGIGQFATVFQQPNQFSRPIVQGQPAAGPIQAGGQF